MEHDPRARALYLLYKHQYGGALYPVFRGSRQVQYGEGFGDIFKSLWKFVLPVVSSSAGTFLTELVKRKGEGADWKESAKGVIKPTLLEAVSRGAEQVSKAIDESKQKGSGKRRRRKGKKRPRPIYKGHQFAQSKSKSNSKLPKYNF